MKKVAYLTLGCDKNRVDTERMLGGLRAAGYAVAEEMEGAWALVVNTCGFIDAAKEESIEVVMEAAKEKERGAFEVLAVVGCLVERFREEMRKEIPEVDLFMGLEHVSGLAAELKRMEEELWCRRPACNPLAQAGGPHHNKMPAGGRRYDDDEETTPVLDGDICAWPYPRFLTTPRHYAFLKIGEGCNAVCRYCAIPRIRGRHRSAPVVELVREAQALEAHGVKELCLVAQDTTAYGSDLDPRLELADLLEKLLAETGIPWIRILYTHPARVTGRLIALIASEPRLLSYLDLPLQHISDRVLAAMGRKPGRAEIVALLDKLGLVPGLVLRTTFMTGYPGEKNSDFRELIEFIEQGRFFWGSGFVFSAQEGTAAAGLPDQVPAELAEERLAQVFETQADVTAARLAEFVGRELTLLVDGPWSPYLEEEVKKGKPAKASTEQEWQARFSGMAVEVDGAVNLKGETKPGEFVKAMITAALDYDLEARIILPRMNADERR